VRRVPIPNRYTAKAKLCFCKNNKRRIIIRCANEHEEKHRGKIIVAIDFAPKRAEPTPATESAQFSEFILVHIFYCTEFSVQKRSHYPPTNHFLVFLKKIFEVNGPELRTLRTPPL
jgi:hypothetical protein